MNIEELRDFVLQKPMVTEGFPFGQDTLVFKVKEKIFLLTGLENSPVQFNVKCNPEKAIEWRERYPDCVLPGYHMNKKHWNTVIVNGNLSKQQLLEMINDSYNLVNNKK